MVETHELKEFKHSIFVLGHHFVQCYDDRLGCGKSRVAINDVFGEKFVSLGVAGVHCGASHRRPVVQSLGLFEDATVR